MPQRLTDEDCEAIATTLEVAACGGFTNPLSGRGAPGATRWEIARPSDEMPG